MVPNPADSFPVVLGIRWIADHGEAPDISPHPACARRFPPPQLQHSRCSWRPPSLVVVKARRRVSVYQLCGTHLVGSPLSPNRTVLSLPSRSCEFVQFEAQRRIWEGWSRGKDAKARAPPVRTARAGSVTSNGPWFRPCRLGPLPILLQDTLLSSTRSRWSSLGWLATESAALLGLRPSCCHWLLCGCFTLTPSEWQQQQK